MATPGSDLKLMMSYSHADAKDFTEELVRFIQAANFDALIDVNDIEAAEDWKARLSEMILGVDTLVIVLTPAWLNSPICQFELSEALAQKKRIIPLNFLPVAEAEVPEAINRLNYIHFDGRQSYGTAFKQLVHALRTDLEWLRQHTVLAERAQRWEAGDKEAAMLLRGAELQRAFDWQAARAPSFPELPISVHAFLNASSEHEDIQQRIRKRAGSWAISVFLIVPLCLILTTSLSVLLNYRRLGAIGGETDLGRYTELLILQNLMDNLGAVAFISLLLISIGTVWLSRNLSTRAIAAMTAAFITLGGVSFVALSAASLTMVKTANALDQDAAASSFHVEPCAPSIRGILDRYRPGFERDDMAGMVENCSGPAERPAVANVWFGRVAPTFFVPLFLVLLSPLLVILVLRRRIS